MQRLLGVLVIITAVLANTTHGGDADPIKAKLDKAKETYQAARAKNKAYVTELLTKLEDKARKAGNASAVEKIKEAIEEFEKGGGLPPGLPATAKQKLLATRTAMDKAFATAVKDYTKQKKDDQAAEVSKEWQVFKLDYADDPSVVRLLNRTSDKYATVSKGGTEPRVVLNQAATNMPQLFRMVPAGGGNWLYFQTLDGQRLLGTDKGGVRNGVDVVIGAPLSGTAAATQQWGLLPSSAGWGRLVHRASNKVVSPLSRSRDNGARLVIWSNEKDASHQDWKLD